MALPSLVRNVPWRNVFRTVACVLAFFIVPLIFGIVNAGSKFASASAPIARAPFTGSLSAPTYDPAKRIAVVVVSAQGAEITDALPTYEILARSGAFNVYVVAPERTLMHFISSNADADPGLDFVPDFSFAGYDATIGKAPDLIAIPYEGIDAASGKAPDLLAWVRAHDGPQTTLLGICVGSSILADTGLLDGHQATTNTYFMDRTAQAHPLVQWVSGVRYVDDGSVITSTNLASGVDATLHAVSRLAGRSVAVDVARQLGYTHTSYLDDPTFQAPNLGAFPLPLIENEMFEWRKEQLGVLLSDGVSEMALAALLDPYTSSMTAKNYVFAPTRAVVRSRDGLTLSPRYEFRTVPALDRVVVPGGDLTASRQQAIAAWEQLRPDRPVEDVHREVGHGVSAYEATLQDLGRNHNSMVAMPIADALFVPTDSLRLADAAWPIEPIATHLALGFLGVAAVLIPGRIPLRRPSAVRPYALSQSQSS
jgi:transcriptional regulator GlxA family with amidase domain